MAARRSGAARGSVLFAQPLKRLTLIVSCANSTQRRYQAVSRADTRLGAAIIFFHFFLNLY